MDRGDWALADRHAARQRSFTWHAVATFFIYLFFWLPGLIVNILFYNEAKRAENIAGTSLPGVGCLSLMLWLNIAIPVTLILLILLL